MKLSIHMVKSPGHWTKVLLCAKSPQVCAPADISSRLCYGHGLWLLWIQSNLWKRTIEFLKKKKKENKITCDVFACGRCIPSASIDVAQLLIAQV